MPAGLPLRASRPAGRHPGRLGCGAARSGRSAGALTRAAHWALSAVIPALDIDVQSGMSDRGCGTPGKATTAPSRRPGPRAIHDATVSTVRTSHLASQAMICRSQAPARHGLTLLFKPLTLCSLCFAAVVRHVARDSGRPLRPDAPPASQPQVPGVSVSDLVTEDRTVRWGGVVEGCAPVLSWQAAQGQPAGEPGSCGSDDLCCGPPGPVRWLVWWLRRLRGWAEAGG